MTKFTKGTITTRHRLYGDKDWPAYIADGVGIVKRHGSWGLYHAASGMEILSTLGRSTLKEAKAVHAKLVALDIDWTVDYAKSPAAFRDVADDVRAIAAEI